MVRWAANKCINLSNWHRSANEEIYDYLETLTNISMFIIILLKMNEY